MAPSIVIPSPTKTLNGCKKALLGADYDAVSAREIIEQIKTLPKNEILPVETITKANVEKWEEACSY